jgi:threonine aldolase
MGTSPEAPMQRRTFLQGSIAAAVAAVTSSQALAQSTAPAAPPAASAPPAFPPIDARSVWLIGDWVPPDPVAMSTRLAALVQGRKDVMDRYQEGGAVAELEQAFARLLGKEDCAFFPSGTLANNVAVRVLCGEHRRALVQHESHLYRDETDAAQRLAGINLIPLAPDRATPTLDEVREAFDESENAPFPMKIGAVSLESPVRRADGEMVPLAAVRAIAKFARGRGARPHLDGARMLLAPPSVDLGAYAAEFDTIYVSLYKYLGAPFGAVLAGSKADIAEARDLRHLYGGALYQGWMPALLASDGLSTFPRDIAQAHARASQLVDALVASGKVRDVSHADASNIRRLAMAQDFAEAAFERGRQAGVRIGRWKDGNIPLFVNTTLLRRPVAEYAALFLG